MKAIRTRALPPTMTKPWRVVAYDGDRNRETISCNAPTEMNNHHRAAIALCSKMHWHGKLAYGWLERGSNVYVWIEDGESNVVTINQYGHGSQQNVEVG